MGIDAIDGAQAVDRQYVPRRAVGDDRTAIDQDEAGAPARGKA